MILLRKFKTLSADFVEPKNRLCFIHIAKCGGVSINQAIRKKYLISYSRLNARASLEAARVAGDFTDPFEDDYESVLRFRENLLLYELEKGCGFVSGHYAFSEKAHARHRGSYKFMTLLRDPVARYLSSYFFNSRKADDSPWKIRESLEEYVQTDYGRRLGRDYVRFIGGLRDDGCYGSDEAIRNARANLRKFDVCGVIEDTAGLALQLRNRCGIRVKIGQKNKSPVAKRDRDRVVTDEIRREIERICAPDLVLYKDAIELSKRAVGEETAAVPAPVGSM